MAILCPDDILHGEIIDWRYIAWRYIAGDILLAIFCWRYFAGDISSVNRQYLVRRVKKFKGTLQTFFKNIFTTQRDQLKLSTGKLFTIKLSI